jgi:hypothetical protein
MRVFGGDAVRSRGHNLAVGFIADPDDPTPESLRAEVFDDELDVDPYDDEDWDEVEFVERAPRRASSGSPRDEAGPRSRMSSMAIGAGLFAEEPGGFDFGGACERGPTARPVEMSRVARARVIELLEEAADGVPLERMRALMRPGRRTKAASEDYAADGRDRVAAGASSRPCRAPCRAARV